MVKKGEKLIFCGIPWCGALGTIEIVSLNSRCESKKERKRIEQRNFLIRFDDDQIISEHTFWNLFYFFFCESSKLTTIKFL